MNFIIYAPGDYACYGGGSIALHKLAHNIASLGEQCFIMTSKKNPDYLGIQIDEAQAKEMAKYGGSMVIYPEVICGNPLQSPHVMRWILYHVRTTGEHGKFADTDLIYKYAPIYRLREKRQWNGDLRAFELNLHLYHSTGKVRTENCFIRKKNPDKKQIHPEGSICLDDVPKNGNYLIAMAEIFNKCKYFYSYDDATWLCNISALCGCKPIVIPNDGLTAKEWYAGFPYFRCGILYGTLESVFDADRYFEIGNTEAFEAYLKVMERESIEQTKLFISQAKIRVA